MRSKKRFSTTNHSFLSLAYLDLVGQFSILGIKPNLYIMKKLFTIAALALATVAFSQTEKGTLFVGGSAGFLLKVGLVNLAEQL